MEINDSKEKHVPGTSILIHSFSMSNFWKFWGANSFSNLGDGIYQLTLPLLAAQLTRSPARVSAVGAMLGLPWLIFALQAGSIVDRFNRRSVMLVVVSGRIFILFLLTLAVATDLVSMPMLYIAALLLGVGETLMDTSLVSIVPALVSKEHLDWANARITAAQTITNNFLGPPMAGYLTGLGFAFATGSSTLMYAATGLSLIAMRGLFSLSAQEADKAEQRWWLYLIEGLRFLWHDRLIRNLTLFTASMNLFWAGWVALFVLYAVRPGPMLLDEFEYSLLLTAMAVGGFLGATLSENLQKILGTRNALALDFIGTIFLVGMPALTTNPILVGVSVFLAGFGASIWVILVSSIRQRLVPGALLGRVYSASRFISWGVGPLGAALAGIFAELWGIRFVFAVDGIICVGLLLVFLNTITFPKNNPG